MQINHTLTETALFKIVKASYDMLPNVSNRSKIIAWKLNISIPEVEHYINLYNNNIHYN